MIPAPKPNTFSVCIDEEFESAESNENQNSTLKSSALNHQESAKRFLTTANRRFGQT